jgi:tetratricopeptide (TPR) repeat protein
LSKAYSLAPTQEFVAITIADRLFRRQDYEKAAKIADFVIAKGGRECRGEAYAIRGLIEQIEKNYKKALKSFEGAVKEKSESMGVRYGLGQMYTCVGDYGKAVAAYKGILEKEPNNYESLKVFGIVNQSRGLHRFTQRLKMDGRMLLVVSTSFGRC